MTVASFLQLVLDALIVWRLTAFLVKESGPLDVFGKLRDVLGVSYDERSMCVGRNPLAQMLCCFWCTSVWVSLLVIAVWDYDPDPLHYIARVLAVSTAAIYLNSRIGLNGAR